MGLIRFGLAIGVIISHTTDTPKLPIPILGREAVILFYIISGFYMALVLNTKYRDLPKKIFLLMRFLRLWPSYIIVVLLTIIVYAFTGELTKWINILTTTNWKVAFLAIFSNIFIIGQDLFWFLNTDGSINLLDFASGIELIFVKIGFTISIELLFYMIAPFIVIKKRNCLIFIAIGLLYHFICRKMGYFNILMTYHTFPSNFVYFGLGGLVYLISTEDKGINKLSSYFIAIIFLIAFLKTTLFLPSHLILAFTFAIPLIFSKTKDNRLDKKIGDISYQIYIIHPIILHLLKYFNINKLYLGILTTIVSIFFAILLYVLVENRINKFRTKLLQHESNTIQEN